MPNVTTFRRTSDFGAFADAALDFPRIIERSTVWPFMCTIVVQHHVEYQDGTSLVSFDRSELFRDVRQARSSEPPVAEDIAAGLGLVDPVVMRSDIFPCSRFDEMSLDVRKRYTVEYEAFLRWKKALSLGKKTAELVPWEEWDPIYQEGEVARWVRSGRC